MFDASLKIPLYRYVLKSCVTRIQGLRFCIDLDRIVWRCLYDRVLFVYMVVVEWENEPLFFFIGAKIVLRMHTKCFINR